MSGFRVRRVVDDAEADPLSRLGAETFTETFSHLYPPDDLDAFLRAFHTPSSYRDLINDEQFGLWVGETEQEELIGYALAGPCDLPIDPMPPRAGELLRLYVRGDHRDLALGASLMNTAMPWLERQYEQIFLGVWSENVGAQRFYARYGFKKVGEYFFKVGKSRDREFILKRG